MHRSATLPEELVDRLARLLDGPDKVFWSGVEHLCAEHPLLARRIESEARAMHAAVHANLSTAPVLGDLAGEPGDPRPGDELGPFVVQRLIGHGGMSSVYLAEQWDPVRRQVALKVIRWSRDTDGVVTRFAAERRALETLDHPHVAKTLFAGQTPLGWPFFAMDYVRGAPITVYCDDQATPLDQRLAMFRQVCSGVEHAHGKGLIHGDLTPNSALVASANGAAAVKIVDFGICRAIDQHRIARALFVDHGVILGTPESMSPEQAGPGDRAVDTRSDVYTLGVLLYELLTGKLPFDAAELRRDGYDGMCRTIRERPPPPPSVQVTTHLGGMAGVARQRRTDAATLRRRLAGDLDAIVLRCLEKDPRGRYQTAAALSEDVRRHLANEPVAARTATTGYRLAKLARRCWARVARRQR